MQLAGDSMRLPLRVRYLIGTFSRRGVERQSWVRNTSLEYVRERPGHRPARKVGSSRVRTGSCRLVLLTGSSRWLVRSTASANPDEEASMARGNMSHAPADQTDNSAVSCDSEGEQAAQFALSQLCFLCLRMFLGSQLQCLPLKIFAPFTWAMVLRCGHVSVTDFAEGLLSKPAQSSSGVGLLECASMGLLWWTCKAPQLLR